MDRTFRYSTDRLRVGLRGDGWGGDDRGRLRPRPRQCSPGQRNDQPTDPGLGVPFVHPLLGSLSVSQEHGSLLLARTEHHNTDVIRCQLKLQCQAYAKWDPITVPYCCRQGEVDGTDCMLFIICPFFLLGGSAVVRNHLHATA